MEPDAPGLLHMCGPRIAPGGLATVIINRFCFGFYLYNASKRNQRLTGQPREQLDHTRCESMSLRGPPCGRSCGSHTAGTPNRGSSSNGRAQSCPPGTGLQGWLVLVKFQSGGLRQRDPQKFEDTLRRTPPPPPLPAGPDKIRLHCCAPEHAREGPTEFFKTPLPTNGSMF